MKKSLPVKEAFSILKSRVNRSRNNVVLLFAGEFVEVYRIARNAYRELGIFFGVSLRVEQSFAVENVYVQVIAAVRNVCVKQVY